MSSEQNTARTAPAQSALPPHEVRWYDGKKYVTLACVVDASHQMTLRFDSDGIVWMCGRCTRTPDGHARLGRAIAQELGLPVPQTTITGDLWPERVPDALSRWMIALFRLRPTFPDHRDHFHGPCPNDPRHECGAIVDDTGGLVMHCASCDPAAFDATIEERVTAQLHVEWAEKVQRARRSWRVRR